jgi:hypothetical protein
MIKKNNNINWTIKKNNDTLEKKSMGARNWIVKEQQNWTESPNMEEQKGKKFTMQKDLK